MTLLINTILLNASVNIEGSSAEFILLAPVAVGIFVWVSIYKYYRNHDKTFDFEEETHIKVTKLNEVTDVFSTHRLGENMPTINGKNSDNHRERLPR